MNRFKLLVLALCSIAVLTLSIKTASADEINKASTTPPVITYVQVPSDPGNVYSKWIYKYTAAPYDFYYNPYLGTWKMVQTTSYMNHMVQTIFNGWATSGPWVPRVYR